MDAGMRSRWLDLDGDVHVADLGGSGQPIVLVHGLGGSYANWVPVAPTLRHLGHVLAVDLPGFGLSPPSGRGASLEVNREVLDRYLRSLDRPVILIGNSMGGAVALRQAARAPETVAGLILVCPAAPWQFLRRPPDPLVAALFAAYVLPGVASSLLWLRRAGISPDTVARWVLKLCAARPELIDPKVVDLHIDVARARSHFPGIDRAFIQATRSVILAVLSRAAFDRDVATVAVPTMVIHGESDRLVPVLAAERLARLRPDWQVEVLANTGHIPMIEDPEGFGSLAGGFIEKQLS